MLSVAELAGIIDPRPGPDRVATVERLRHWSAVGLLEPTNDRNPGTGRKRAYSPDAIYSAALLNALANLGLSIGMLRHHVVDLAAAERAREQWKTAPSTLILEIADIGLDGDGGARHAVFLHHHDDGQAGHSGIIRSEVSIVIDIGRLFRRADDRLAALLASKAPRRGRNASSAITASHPCSRSGF